MREEDDLGPSIGSTPRGLSKPARIVERVAAQPMLDNGDPHARLLISGCERLPTAVQ
jgi:hypothetical protein